MSSIVALLLVAVSTAVSQEADSFALRRIAKAGDVAKYRTKFEFRVDDGLYTIETLTEETVVGVERGTHRIQVNQVEARATLPDGTMARPNLANYVRQVNENGEVVSFAGATTNEDSIRAANLDTFRPPPRPQKLGGKWRHEIKADRKTAAIGVRLEYEVLSVEEVLGVRTVRVRYTAMETGGPEPASAVGMVWIDPTDGSVMKREVDYRSAPFPPFPIPMIYRMTVERVR
jgi:hypothetical protein